MITFDHAAKRIGVPSADAQPLLLQTLIDSIRDEEASERGIVEPQIADAVGKDDLGGSVVTGITVNLRSSWMLQFATGAYQARIDGGNLANALSRIANTSSPQVLVQSSAAATIAETGVSGLTSDEVALLLRIEKFLRNKRVTDPNAGTQTVFDDDGVTVLAEGALFEDAAGTQPYRGQGADRAERLA